jgi:hypothetical protein
MNFLGIVYSNSVHTSQETHYISAAKSNWIVLFRETISVCCENYTEHINTWSGCKITGLIFLPTPCGLGNRERGGILACPLLFMNPTTSKAIRPTMW